MDKEHRMSKSLVAIACVSVALAGCASQLRQQASTSDTTEANMPLMCESEKHCQASWRLAQVWVAQNSHWKIQTATDAIIETYNSTDGSRSRVYRITREPIGARGREQIKIASGCRNVVWGCEDNEDVMAASFKRFVRNGATE